MYQLTIRISDTRDVAVWLDTGELFVSQGAALNAIEAHRHEGLCYAVRDCVSGSVEEVVA